MAGTGFVGILDALNLESAAPRIVSERGRVQSAVFSPDDRLVLAVGVGRVDAQLYDTRTGHPAGAAMTHQKPPRAGAFSPDGRKVVTGSRDASVRVWEVPSGSPVTPFLWHTGLVAVFSPDGRQIAAAGQDGRVRVWRRNDNFNEATELRAGRTAQHLAFSPDGRWIAVAENGALALLEIATGKVIRPGEKHAEAISSVTFNAGWHAGFDRVTERPGSAGFRPAEKILKIFVRSPPSGGN